MSLETHPQTPLGRNPCFFKDLFNKPCFRIISEPPSPISGVPRKRAASQTLCEILYCCEDLGHAAKLVTREATSGSHRKSRILRNHGFPLWGGLGFHFSDISLNQYFQKIVLKRENAISKQHLHGDVFEHNKLDFQVSGTSGSYDSKLHCVYSHFHCLHVQSVVINQFCSKYHLVSSQQKKKLFV